MRKESKSTTPHIRRGPRLPRLMILLTCWSLPCVGLLWLMRHEMLISQWLVVGCASVYALRTSIASLVFLKRAVPWGEALVVSVWLMMLEALIFYAAGGRVEPLGLLDVVAVVLYLTGSGIHNLAEYQRYRFKADPANKGKLFTRGLFGMVRHPNYLGDVLLFTGWCLLTGNLWTLMLPAVMLTSFVFGHIPRMTDRLASHYPEQFPEYAARTARLVPGVY